MMNDDKAMQDCTRKCWILSAIMGAVLAVLLLAFGGWGFFRALILGLIVFGVFGFLMKAVLCPPRSAQSQGTPAQKPAAQKPPAQKPAASQPAATKPEPAAKTAPVADATAPETEVAAEGATPAASEPAKADKAVTVKPSARLAGQEELAARKGDWKYEKPADETADKPAEKPVQAIPAASTPAEPVVDDVSGSGSGSKPAKPQGEAEPAKRPAVAPDGKPKTLSAPREGGPDDLKMIKGVGPKLESLLHDMGIYHFSQVASWRKKEVKWADQNLVGFKGRVSRDEWVKQARELDKGRST